MAFVLAPDALVADDSGAAAQVLLATMGKNLALTSADFVVI